MSIFNLRKVALFIPLLFVIGFFGSMAVLGLLGAQELKDIVSVLNVSDTNIALLVRGIFVLDGAVVLLLIFGNKLSAQFPWHLLFIWTAVWPWVPRVLEYMGGREPEIPDALALTVASILAWYFAKKKNTLFFARK